MTTKTHTVIFTRYLPDDIEILPPDSTRAQRFDLMRREFIEADRALVLTEKGNIEAGDYDVFVCTLEHDGDDASLATRLQKAYDDFGVGGFFQVCQP